MRIIYMGSPEFALFGLESIYNSNHDIVAVVTREDKIKGRKKTLEPTAVKKRALELGIKVYTPKDPNEPDFITELSALDPDILVISAYGRILKRLLLTLAPYGAVNIHGSLLPAYRGASPINAAIRNGETVTGVTIMYMNQGMDEGDICLKKDVPIDEGDNFALLRDKMGKAGGQLILEALEMIEKGAAPRFPQNDAEATYCGLLTRNDEKLDWSEDVISLHNHIRSIAPEPGAFTYLRGEVVKIIESSYEKAPHIYEVGKVLGVDKKNGVQVAADGGWLWLRRVKPAGKKEMQAVDWYRGLRDTENLSFTTDKEV
ncbi:MAG: methionyl-tRNA formyltransferase [Bacillota bacterium]|nr:methionyl-tRNA formyltransferase [Bacillota bacterium]